MAATTARLAELLLDPAITLGPFDTFPQFQELFPSKYRNHPDTRLLYRAFQRQRRIVREKVAKNINRRYKKGLQRQVSLDFQNTDDTENQSLEQAVKFLERKTKEAKEDLKTTRDEISSLEKNIKKYSSCFEEASPIYQLSPGDISQVNELMNLETTVLQPPSLTREGRKSSAFSFVNNKGKLQ